MKFSIKDSEGKRVSTIDIEGARLHTLRAYAEFHGLSLEAAVGKILEEELARATARLLRRRGPKR